MDEYDEPYEDDEEEDEEDEGNETSSADSAMNDYECEEMHTDFAQQEMMPTSSEEDEDEDSDGTSGSDGCSAGTSTHLKNSVVVLKEECPTLPDPQRQKDSQLLSYSSPDGDDEIDDIGREFYEYINAEFASPSSAAVGSSKVSEVLPSKKTVESSSSSVREHRHQRHQSRNDDDDDKRNDYNNNPLTTLDDEDFW